MEFKITVTDTAEYEGETKINVWGRDKNNELRQVYVTGVPAYFYAPTEKVKEKEATLVRQDNVEEIDHDPDVQGWKGENLSEIRLYDDCSHWDVMDTAEENFETYERFDADVFMADQFRIRNNIYSGVRVNVDEFRNGMSVPADKVEPVEIKEFRSRIAYIDIEVDDRGEFVKDGSRPITSIVAQDSYTEEVVGFFWTGSGRTIEDCFPNGRPEKLDELHWSETEEQMLESFRDYINNHDPDLWTGWNFEDFDAPYILNRFDELDLDGTEMSRNGYCRVGRNNEAYLGGRVMYDLQYAWERTKRKEPDSTALDNVAKSEIDAQKIEHPGMGYHEMWEKDPELLMNYNAVDVTLCKRLNEELGTLSFWRTIGDVVGVDWDDTRANSDYIEMFCRRKLHEKDLVGPVKDYGRPKADYEGGYVFDAYNGRARNVMGLDLASLYPNSMAMGNLSPEMKVTDDEAETLQRAGIPVCETPNGSKFRLDKDGIFKELVDDAIGLKEDAKAKRNTATPGTEEHDRLAEEYMAKKTVTNSIYGVLGWEPFFLYDEGAAESTTLLGQAVIKKTSEYIENKTEAEVIYGDTDSNYIKFPEDMEPEEVIRIGNEVCDILNEEVYPEFATEFGIPAEMNRWDIEPEVLMDTFFQSGDKKLYAYKAIWEDGKWMDEPDYTYKGYSFKKSNTSELTTKTGYKLMDAILDWEDESEINSIIYNASQSIDPDNPDWERIGIPQGLGKEIHVDCECEDCYSWSKTRHTPKGAHERGAYFMNILSGRAELEQGSKPKRVYLEPTMTVGEAEKLEKVDVIAFEKEENLDGLKDDLQVNVPDMTEKIIEKPFDNILSAVGMDVSAAIEGQQQTGFAAFM